MPRRPPKDWWYRCVAGVGKSGGAADPKSVCGALWYKKLSAGQRSYRVRKENPRCTTRLVFLPTNQAWVFLFGEQLLRLDEESMFFQHKAQAVSAAKSKGLSVSKNGCVSSDFSLNPNPWRWANPYGGS